MRAVLIQKLNVERLGEILSEIVRSARLQALAVVHHRFHAESRDRAREFFLFRLAAREYGYGEAGFGKFFIDAQHFHGLFHRLFLGSVDGVPFLPQKLAGTEERAGGLFPAHDVRPLVYENGQIAVGLQPLGIHFADDGLAGRTDHERLREFFAARVRDDGDFGRKALHVLRLSL